MGPGMGPRKGPRDGQCWDPRWARIFGTLGPEIDNVKDPRWARRGHDVFPWPGVEVRTRDGHMSMYDTSGSMGILGPEMGRDVRFVEYLNGPLPSDHIVSSVLIPSLHEGILHPPIRENIISPATHSPTTGE